MCVMEEAHEEHCTQAIMTHELSTCSVILFFATSYKSIAKKNINIRKFVS